jgi:hypothetical protein
MKRMAVGAIVATLLIAGCTAASSQQGTSEPSGESASATPSPSPSEPSGPSTADLRVARIIVVTGARTDAAVVRLFRGSADLPEAGLRQSAIARTRTAAQIAREANAASHELSRLARLPPVSVAVANWGVFAFSKFELCGREAVAFFSRDPSGAVAKAAGRQARKTCNSARAAYAKAKRKAETLPRGTA